MKNAKYISNGVTLLIMIPMIYAGMYLAFITFVQQIPAPFTVKNPGKIVIYTKNQPAIEAGVSVFRPAMWVHRRTTGTLIQIQSHPFA